VLVTYNSLSAEPK